MDLKRRLADLDRLTRKADATAIGSAAGRVDPLEAMKHLQLERRDGQGGEIWVREYFDAVRIPMTLPSLEGLFTRAAPPGVKTRDLLFLDTETTGLAGGTGTLAFLVGVSWYAEGGLVTRQFFLSGPGREAPMLDELAALARKFKVIVTFNGASFDLPLLRTRARLERRDDPCADLVSWDLLVPVRRLWGNQLIDCRQQTLEAEILSWKRGVGDIDGSRIPQTWFDFLAQGRTAELEAVLRHNRRDMRGMAGLFEAVVAEAGRMTAAREGDETSWRLAWARGRICEHRRDHRAAARWLESAAEGAVSKGGRDAERCLRDAVRVLKRSADWRRVEALIQAGLTVWAYAPWLHREAAILYEHRMRRIDAALEHARFAGEERRVRRLEIKRTRQGTRSSGAEGRASS